jgi:hypothetical protein
MKTPSLSLIVIVALAQFPLENRLHAEENKTSGSSKAITKAEERGTLEDRTEKIRGDSGKWSDLALLQVSSAPAASTDKGSLDQWADSLGKKKSTLTSEHAIWLIYRSEQLDDNDRVWLESIERDEEGKKFTITFARATWLGNYSKNFTWYSMTGVNLGKLLAGEYEVTWIEKPLEFKRFVDPKNHVKSWPEDEKASPDSSPIKAKLKFKVIAP